MFVISKDRFFETRFRFVFQARHKISTTIAPSIIYSTSHLCPKATLGSYTQRTGSTKSKKLDLPALLWGRLLCCQPRAITAGYALGREYAEFAD
jgi:hypothetical protein